MTSEASKIPLEFMSLPICNVIPPFEQVTPGANTDVLLTTLVPFNGIPAAHSEFHEVDEIV